MKMDTKDMSFLGRNFVITLAVLCLMVTFIHTAADAQIEQRNSAIVTTGDIEITTGFKIVNGHLCSRQGNIMFNTQKEVKVPEDITDTTWIVNAETGNILCNGNNVFLAHAEATFVSPACNTTQLTNTPVACPADPPFADIPGLTCNDTVPFPITPGLGVTKCNGNIGPGDYGDIIVDKQSACTFDGAGVYNIRSIWVKNGGRILFNPGDPVCDPTRRFDINVKRFVLLAHRVSFNPEGIYAVFVNVEGEDNATYMDDLIKDSQRCKAVEGNGPAAFCHRGDGNLKMCRLYVPNGSVVVNGALKLDGLTYAKNFAARKRTGGLAVTVDIPDFETCCEFCEPPIRICGCIFDFQEKGNPDDRDVTEGATIAAQGFNLTPASVKKVIFIDATANPNVDVEDPINSSSVKCTTDPIAFNPPGVPGAQNSIEFVVPNNCKGTFYLGIVNGEDTSGSIVNGNYCIDNLHVLTVN
jgi:hypothetical protein